MSFPVSYQYAYTTYRGQAGFSNMLGLAVLDTSYLTEDILTTMRGYGTSAMAAANPNNSPSSLYTAVHETLSDGLPKALGVETWENRTKLARAAGKEYLNYEFGWLPFVSDLQSFAHSVKNSHRIISEMRAHAGGLQRVSYGAPASISGSGDGASGYVSLMPPDPPAGMTSVSQIGSVYHWVAETSVSERAWFTGAFYVVDPAGDDTASKLGRYAREADRLLGVLPTPDHVYQAAPWTWAFDWFSNAGAVVSNVSDMMTTGSSPTAWAYSMHERILTRSAVFSFADTVYGGGPTKFTGTSRISRKFRIPASPFGFTVDWPDFTARQVAILGSLGVTR